MNNPLSRIPMFTLMADAPLWADVAEDRDLRMAMYSAMIQVDMESAPTYLYLAHPELVWAHVGIEARHAARAFLTVEGTYAKGAS